MLSWGVKTAVACSKDAKPLRLYHHRAYAAPLPSSWQEVFISCFSPSFDRTDACCCVGLQLLRKLESAKGAEWAKKFQEDLKYVQWFDSSVAQDPAVGPRVSA